MAPVSLNLLSLKCLLFLFFGGLGCLIPGLWQAGYKVGLCVDEVYLISVAAPMIAVLGPLIAAPIADRLGVPAQGSTARYGRYMRAMFVMVTLLGAVAYTALLYVPQVSRLHERNPPVSFVCSPDGAVVMQDQCKELPCYNWPEDNRGTLFLSSCHYVCGDEPIPPGSFSSTQPPRTNFSASDEDYGEISEEEDPEDKEPRARRGMPADMPHLCFARNGQSVCHVYSEFSKQLPINVTLTPSLPPQDSSQWCSYKIVDKITCKQPLIPASQAAENCTVVCDLDEPYNSSGSLLVESECRNTFGDPQLTFWSFLLLRGVADIFPTTALALLASCLVVAARETPALLCRQLIYAVIGYTIVPPMVDLIIELIPTDPVPDKHLHSYGYYIFTFAILSVVSSLILFFDKSLPLSPVDYHLHSPGPLTVRGTGGQVGALSLILVLLGVLSCSLDSYIPWESVFLALIPSLLVLWYSEKVIDYCGHSNILILAFTFYIIRFTGLLFSGGEVLLYFLFGALEVFTLVISWSTAILYLRHLMPRHFLVTGQALLVISFFCIGRCIGSMVGALLDEHLKSPTVMPKWSDYISFNLYEIEAVLAATVASLYFVLYHFFLKHIWRKQTISAAQPVIHETNANGTYTPLKVYNQPEKDQRIRY